MTETHRRTWWDLSRAEATTIFNEVVATHPQRVEGLLDAVADRGGPRDRLDFTRASLHVLWDWVLQTQHAPVAIATDAEMRAVAAPWWYEFHAPLAQRLGPDLSCLATLIAAYFAETVLRRRPGTTWVLGRDREAADYHQPLLQVPGRGRFSPDSIVLSVTSQWVNGRLGGAAPLAEIYDIHAGSEPADAVSATASGPPAATVGTHVPGVRPYAIERGASGRFETVISFADDAATDAPGGVERIERMVAALAREPGIEAAVHEDRELALVRAPGLDDARLIMLVDRLWDASG